MSKIVRHEFMGSWLLFGILCIFLPLAILYLFFNTIRIESDMDEPERFVEEFRAGKLTRQ